MKLSREGEGGASGLDERGEDPAEQSFTDVGDEPFIAAPVMEIERGVVLAGRYQIETTIGRGGSGLVLRAFDRIAEAAVAVKILKPELAADPRWVERFSRELRLARQIQHPNVCRVFDIGEADGHRFLTMELASQGTLRTGGRGDAAQRPLEARVADARALVSGVAAIHAAGIVHRDVKPENMLRMDDGRLVVSDFGLATNPTQSAAVTLMVGTPSYMAPEMAMGDPASFRSDVWALGVVMHEILFGRRPEWDATARERVFRSPVDKDTSPVLRALAQLCADCSTEHVPARPADAVEVRRRFEQAEHGTAPAPASRRLSGVRWGWAALAAAMLIALAATTKKRWWPGVKNPVAGVISGSGRTLALGGTALDVSAARRVATFDGRVHCVSLLPGERSLRVIAGDPRQAFDVDAATGARVQSPLRAETYAFGCPVLSSDGRELLYETIDQTGAYEIAYSKSPDGDAGRVLTKGRYPEWIPNTEDFVFDIDLTHAAVFSTPVMNSSLVSDDLSGQRRLIEKAVSARGDLLALRYLDDRGENLFIVHSLPALEIMATFSLVGSARNLHFDRRTDQLEVSVDGPHGNSLLALVDWRAGMAQYHASLVEWDLRNALTDDRDTTFLVSRRLLLDVWEYAALGAPPRRLTSDGLNDNAARSSSGRLLIQKRRRTGGYVVVLFDEGAGSPTKITAGPWDLTPSFAERNRDWFFVRNDRQAIVRCDRDNACREIHVDPQMPAWPVASPDGMDLAYLTWLNTPRLKVLSLQTGLARDLGAALVDCAPVWSDSQHVWVVQSSEHLRAWTEIDVPSGHRTGRQKSVGDGPSESERCALSDGVLPARYPQVRVLERETSEIRAIRAPEWR
jgi:serine/threonine protein kinase